MERYHPTIWFRFLLAIVAVVAVSGASSSAAATQPIVISGRVYDSATGQGYAGVLISLCKAGSTRTGATGNWQLTVPYGTSYCARVTSGVPAGLVGPKTRNNPEIGAYPSYEDQVAGVVTYHNKDYPPAFQRWDRIIDSGLDFAYFKPIGVQAPVVSPEPAATVTPLPASPTATTTPSSSPTASPTPTQAIAATAPSPSPKPFQPWFRVSNNDLINISAIIAVVLLVAAAIFVVPLRAIRRRQYQEYLRSKYYDL